MPPSGLHPSLAAYLGRRGHGDSRVVALTGDASSRKYYRVIRSDGDSYVVALHPEAFAPGSLPFTNVAELFAAMPLPVPRVRDEAADLGVVALDDLGDVTLQTHVASAPATEHFPLYRRAVDYIATIQRRGRELADARFLPYHLAFDVDKLMWEMDFFLRHFLEAFRGIELGPADRAALRARLAEIVEELAGEPRVLCHRDYHSRNLMVRDDELFVIDFQDARMGPNTYDLVSLLRDAYVDLPSGLVAELMDRFRTAAGIIDDAETFDRRFTSMVVQRGLKALGTFGYQTTALANPAYTQYIPRTLAHVRHALANDSRFDALRGLLADGVPEFA